MALENQDTITGDNLRNKTRTIQKKKMRKNKVYLSFMTIILLLCVVQVAYSALFNISKIVVYRGKIIKAQELKEAALQKNKRLKNELDNFNSTNRVESIARNNLKMAGENEVLVIINTPDAEDKPKTKKEQFLDFIEKNIVDKIIRQNQENNPDFILP